MSDVFGLGENPQLGGLKPLAPDFAPSELGGTFYGTGDELLSALPRAASGAAATVNLLAAPLVMPFGQEATDKWFATMVDPPLRSLEQMNQRSAINGTAAKVIGQIAPVVLESPLGPVGVGALEAAKRTGLEIRAGKEDALALGAVSGATMAAGFAMPMALPVMKGWGPALLQRMTYGVGSNVALGAAQRGAEEALGEDARVLDGTALAVDAALGAFFGAAGHAYLRMTGERAPAGQTVESARPAADAAMTMTEQAAAQRVVPPGEHAQPFLDHLAAKEQAAQAGREIPDPPVPDSVEGHLDRAAAEAEATFRAADPALDRLDEAGEGKPEPLPVVEAKKEPAPMEEPNGPRGTSEPEPVTTWNPVNTDGDAVPFDLNQMEQTAAQLDALGLKADDGRSYSDILNESAKTPEDANALLDAVTQCALNYGN